MEGFVVGHWSNDGKIKPQHINGIHCNVFPFKNTSDLKKQIIQVFSFDGQTVIDGDPKNGEFHKFVSFLPVHTHSQSIIVDYYYLND